MTLGNDLASRVRSIGRGFAVTAAIGTAAGAAATGYGLWEKNQFVLREETLPILPAGFGPFRILHLSDIHFVPGQHRKARVAVLPGGTAAGPRGEHGRQPQPCQGRGPPRWRLCDPCWNFPGVFVPGSNDYFGPSLKNPASYLLGPSGERKDPERLDWPRLRSEFGMSGWVDLTNRCQSLVLKGMRFDFSGVDDPHLRLERYAGWPRGTKGRDADPHLRIAVAHAPYQRVLDHFTEAGAHLLLAGHTHGGQICVPGYGALVTNCDLPDLAGPGAAHLGKQREDDAGERLGRHRHVPLRPGPHRLPARSRSADADLPRLGLAAASPARPPAGWPVDMPSPRARAHGTCPPLVASTGHRPTMPTRRGHHWTCPTGPGTTTGHVPPGAAPLDMSRGARHPRRRRTYCGSQ